MKKVGWIIVVVLIVVLGAVGYFWEKPTPTNNQTLDKTATWRTFTSADGELSFKYPDITTTYVAPLDWPPTIDAVPGSFTCTAGQGDVGGRPGETLQQTIAGRTYCITIVREGAAGTTYVDYTYTVEQNAQLITAKLTMRYPVCENYSPDSPEKTACDSETQNFDVDGMIDSIIQTVDAQAQT
jgi:hypothetical protein